MTFKKNRHSKSYIFSKQRFFFDRLEQHNKTILISKDEEPIYLLVKFVIIV